MRWCRGAKPVNLATLLCGSEGTLAVSRRIELKLSPLPQEQGARHLPLRHLPQGHGGGPAHRQAGAGGGGGGGPHPDRAGPRHRHVPPGDGDLRARRARRAAAGGVRRGRPGREPAPARPARRADGRSRPSRQRGEGGGRGRPEGGVGGARLGPQHHDVDEERGKARLLHRGLRGAAGASRRLHRAAHRHLREARHRAAPGTRTPRVGCLHVRPVLNLKLEKDASTMRAIAEEAFAMVKDYKGSHSGEHGDGLVRSEFHEQMYGRQDRAPVRGGEGPLRSRRRS